MNIIFVLTEIAVGGAERVVLDLCNELHGKGHKCSVIALKKLNYDDIMVKAFKKDNIDIHTLNADKKNPFRLFALKKIIADLKPDIVSAHLFHPNILSRLLLKKRDFKLVNTIHIMEIRKSQKWRFALDKMTFKMADIHTAVSQAAATFQEKKLSLRPGSIKVIRNGIRQPLTFNSEQISQMRQKWGVDDCDIVLGSVGRLNHQKGYDLLLNMTDKICKKIPNRKIGMVFIGDGPEKENLQKLADAAPDQMKIVFAGYSADAASECSAFDVFLMPSRFEGLPLSLIEAAAHGLPVVVQNIPTAIEVIADYKNSFITDFNNAEKAAEQIADSLKNNRLAKVNTPTIEKMADKYLAVFNKN